MNDDTHTERLFTAEYDLRTAALEYSAKQSNDNRRKLREAALLYADASNDVDEAMEALIGKRSRAAAGDAK